jgi:hypothetical protein
VRLIWSVLGGFGEERWFGGDEVDYWWCEALLF